MKRILAFLAAFAVPVILALPARGQTNWTGNSTADWFSPFNWSNGVPDASSAVTINTTGLVAARITNGAATAQTLKVGQILNGRLEIFGGSLTVGTSVAIASGVGSTGSLTMGGGLLTIGGGTAPLQLTDAAGANGVLNVGSEQGSTSQPPGLFNVASISSLGTAVVNFNHTSTGYSLTSNGAESGVPIPLTGTLAVRHLSGVTSLSAPSNYTGGTTVDGGTLLVNNTSGSGTGSGAVTVNGGTFAGNGSVAGNVSAFSGAILSPGAIGASIGTLTINGNLVWNAGALVAIDVGNTTSDRIAVGGVLSKAGTGAYRFDFKNVATPGTYTLITFVSSAFAASDFTCINLPQGLSGTFTVIPGDRVNVTIAPDTTPPTVSISEPSVTNTLTGPVSYTVTFGDADPATITLVAANVTQNSTGTASGTIDVTGTGSERTVTISNIVGSGTLGISIAAGVARDQAGNASLASAPSQTFTVANSVPTITSPTTAAATYGAAFSYQITATGAATFDALNLPPGLTVATNTGLISGTPTVAGVFNVTIRAIDAFNNPGAANLQLTVAPRAVTVTGLTTVSRLYDGTTAATLNATNAVLNGVLAGDTGNVTLNIANATAAFTDPNVGINKAVTVTGLALAGSAAANYSLTPPVVTGNVTGTPATISLTNLNQVYDGSPKSVTATTVPSGLPVAITYNGNASPPTNAGTYSIVATVATPTFGGSATGTLLVAQATQTVTFAALPDRLTTDAPFTLNASASTALPITFTATGPATVVGNTVILSGSEGLVSITATQAGEGNYAAASVTRTFTVRTRPVPGVYFGSITGDRSDAAFGLLVRPDNTASFIAFLPNLGWGLQSDAITSQQPGAFSGTFTPVGTSASVTVRFSIGSNGAVNGTIDPMGLAFSGTSSGALPADTVPGPSTASLARPGETPQPGVAEAVADAGYYRISAVGSSGTTRVWVLVGADARGYVLTSNGSQASGLATTFTSSGAADVTLPNGSRLVMTFGSGGTVDGTLTVAGGAPQHVVGGTEAASASLRMLNMSARGRTGSGDAVLIAGFVINGASAKRVVVRVAGPVLTNFGVTNVLANPNLTIKNSAGTIVGTNDDWGVQNPANPDVATQMLAAGGFPFAAASKDAAIVLRLAPGPYTVLAGGGDGTVLTEVYELLDTGEAPAAKKIVNFSARGQIGVANEPLTAGFVIAGNVPKRVLIRGIGPTIASVLPGAIANPRVRVFDSTNTKLAENDDWFRDANASQIAAAASSVGAFALGAQSLDASLLIVLQPGAYTAIVDDAGGGAGLGLVEVYEVP